MSARQPNRLKNEKSPYLLQHAHNPVDWFPWSDEAFEKAKQENKPIFLSIGYSTCHWCHVMEKESFENDEIAGMLNKDFISIKLDREERPDLDSFYMLVCQALTGAGGWPLTIVMTPDKRPFFAGTYFPRIGGYGRPGMRQLVPHLADLWRKKQDELLESADEIVAAVSRAGSEAGGGEVPASTLDRTYDQFVHRYDKMHGGFGPAPKFPSPHNVVFLLRHYHFKGEQEALAMALKTLTKMRLGGMYDHAGGGFHRYSTDALWLVPHFEKMLYDQATLMRAYTEAWQLHPEPLFKQTVDEIYHYVARDLRGPEGAFYSAEDADSEGEEGKFYVWSVKELESLFPDDIELLRTLFSLEEGGNFHDPVKGGSTGENILHLKKPLEDYAGELNLSKEALRGKVDSIFSELHKRRCERTRPHLDDKILTDWNGMMIASLAYAGRIFGDDEYTDAAVKAAKFILGSMRNSSGGLFHRHRGGETGITGMLDDYAYMLSALLELYETTGDASWLAEAVRIAEKLKEKFTDTERGGFYLSAKDEKDVIIRQKDFYDGAAPSGNSASAVALFRLARLTGKTEYEEDAKSAIEAVSGEIERAPTGFTHLLTAVQYLHHGFREVVVAGPAADEKTAALKKAAQNCYLPNSVFLIKDTAEPQPEIDTVAEFVKPYGNGTDSAVYICENFACSLPVTDPAEVEKQLCQSKG